MDCPNCGVYNPEDRDHCWRCGTELPKHVERKRRDPQASARTWLYVAVGVMVLVTLLRMCGVSVPGMGGAPDATGCAPVLRSVAQLAAAFAGFC